MGAQALPRIWNFAVPEVAVYVPVMVPIGTTAPAETGMVAGAGMVKALAMFATTDGLHPTLLALQLGHDYIIWDKAGAIRYRKPGRAPLFAEFHIDDAETELVREIVARDGECERTYTVELKDRHGVVHTIVERTVYIADKAFYRNKVAA